MSIKILLAEDHTIVRKGLRSLIEQHDDMKVVAEAGDGIEAVQLTMEKEPDIVIMDVSMPKLNGIEATKQIKAKMPNVKVLVLSVHDDREFVMDMVRAGMSGYLLKDCVYDELITAVHTIIANNSYLSPQIASVILEEHNFVEVPTANVSRKADLKDSERHLLRLLAEGFSARQIAEKYDINIKTVEARRRRIMRKLGIDNFSDLIKYAIRKGLISY